MLAIGGTLLPPGETWWHIVAAPPEDGGWKFTTIDGVDVRNDGYSLGIRWGKITGYHDGCNGCGFDDDKPMGARDRSMMCTLVACPPSPHDELFGRFAFGAPAMKAEGDRLVLTLPGGHRAQLVRAPARRPD